MPSRPRLPPCHRAKAMLAAACAAAGVATPAFAQLASALVRGQVTSQGQPQANASIVATELGTGYTLITNTSSDGRYVLVALPPGTYRIVASVPGQREAAQRLTVRVGQNVALNLALDPLQPVPIDTVIVSSQRDTHTSEVATYVTLKQIASLPQATRNFLAFADLAPGVVFTANPDRRELRGGALPAANVNVYVDGVAQKSYVLPGGITGQDASSGNPFPQSAIAEYKVITQNYKAEYDQVSSVAVAAVTRSGTNRFRGEVFWDHTGTGWREATPAERAAGAKVRSREDQFGLTLGGPIVRDRIHWFLAYEGKQLDRPETVAPGLGAGAAELPASLRGEVGPASSPFREDLAFGKLDWTLDDHNLLELSLRLRREDDVTGVGGLNAASWGTSRLTEESRVDLHHQRTGDDWANDLHLTWEDARFSPRPRTIAPGIVLTGSEPSETVLNAGGGPDFQRKSQRGPALQNDTTWAGLEWLGRHVLKFGAKWKQVTVEAAERIPFNPQYSYDIADPSAPYRVAFGAALEGDGGVSSRNSQIGAYLQDDWEVNKNLTLNLGLRWDYERTPAYLDHVTPPDVVQALRASPGLNAAGSGIEVERYISDGGNRRPFRDAWQPRLGFAFDLNADQAHVIFGGHARAYDRTLFDYLQLERTKAAFARYEFDFATELHPCDGPRCLAWDPAYLDPVRLQALAAGGGSGREIYLLDNRLKPPRTDQSSLGMRNRLGPWNTEIVFSRIESRDGFVFLLGNRRPDGSFFAPGTTWGPPFDQPLAGYGTLLLGTNGLRTRADAVLLRAEKPYSEESRWTAAIAYTYTDARENRQFGEHYALDHPDLAGYGWRRAGGVSRHRIVATAIADGPGQTMFSMRLTLATPAPRYGTNCLDSPPAGSACRIDQIEPDGARFGIGGPIWGYRQVDLAFAKSFDVPGGTLRLRADLINLFDTKNYEGYDTWWGSNGNANPNLGRPDGSLAGPTRTLKLGLAYLW